MPAGQKTGAFGWMGSHPNGSRPMGWHLMESHPKGSKGKQDSRCRHNRSEGDTTHTRSSLGPCPQECSIASHTPACATASAFYKIPLGPGRLRRRGLCFRSSPTVPLRRTKPQTRQLCRRAGWHTWRRDSWKGGGLGAGALWCACLCGE
jgi:hypothetical protein